MGEGMKATYETKRAAFQDGEAQAKAAIKRGEKYNPNGLNTDRWQIPANVWQCVAGFERAWGRP